jgi:electron transfer flavoprotein beta subunit
MDEATGTMIRDGVEAIVNPLDLFAIEIAIRLREQHGGEVIAVSMGPPKAVTALKEAIAMGCDSAVLISGKAFAGSDTWATSYVLAAGIRTQAPFDLIICGERATDGDTGQVGPGIASFLDLPLVTYVSKVRSFGPDEMVVERLVEEGHEVLAMSLPGVLTVVKEACDPRLPTLRGKQRARQAELACWGHEQLGLPREKVGLAGSPTRVIRLHRPSVARQCRRLIAADEESAALAVRELVDILRQKNLL